MISGALAWLHIEVIVVSSDSSAAASASTWTTSATSSSAAFSGRAGGVATRFRGTVLFVGLVVAVFGGVRSWGILGRRVLNVVAFDLAMALVVLFAVAPLRVLVFLLFSILVGRFLAFARG